eukprot:365721-Chlamydomonas_euryale.AAC.9
MANTTAPPPQDAAEHAKFVLTLKANAELQGARVGARADTVLALADTALAPADTALAPADTALAPADTALVPADTALAPADTALATQCGCVSHTERAGSPHLVACMVQSHCAQCDHTHASQLDAVPRTSRWDLRPASVLPPTPAKCSLTASRRHSTSLPSGISSSRSSIASALRAQQQQR